MDPSLHCMDHTGQVECLEGLKSRVNLLVALTGGFGTIIVGVLLTILSSLSTVNVSLATVASAEKSMEADLANLERRVSIMEQHRYLRANGLQARR